jgi:hypothetical protein
MQRVLACVLAGAFAAGCASTTMIRSSNPNAKIYVDGELKGTGTASVTDTKIVGSVTHVRMEAPGCQSQSFDYSRSEEFDAGACAGGVFLLVPFLWVMKYKPEHTYEYDCRPPTSLQVPLAPPPPEQQLCAAPVWATESQN